ALWTDQERALGLRRRQSELEPIVDRIHQRDEVEQQMLEAQALLDGPDEELRLLAEEELRTGETRLALLERELRDLLSPPDPRDNKDVIVEVRAGAGGDEAALFAGDLLRMYGRYAERHNWQIEMMDESPTDIGGFKEVIFAVKGRGAFSRLKFESGV
ncbi:peptide chain release factor 1, partial [mine drainage metagenome]